MALGLMVLFLLVLLVCLLVVLLLVGFERNSYAAGKHTNGSAGRGR